MKKAVKEVGSRKLESVREFRQAASRVVKEASRSPEAARAFLREAGLVTAKGRPTKPFR